MRNIPNSVWLVSGLVLIITGSAVYLYTSKFGFGFEYISSDHEKWGQFSDFFNLFVSVASLLVLAALTWQIHKNEQKRDADRIRDEENRERDRRQYEQWMERPILIFENDSDHPNFHCSVKNVGRGAAINMIFIEGPPVNKRALQLGESLKGLMKERDELTVHYQDIFNNRLVATV